MYLITGQSYVSEVPAFFYFSLLTDDHRVLEEQKLLTLKAPITTAAVDSHKYLFIVFSEKIRLGVPSESSARQRVHMKKSSLIFFKRKN